MMRLSFCLFAVCFFWLTAAHAQDSIPTNLYYQNEKITLSFFHFLPNDFKVGYDINKESKLYLLNKNNLITDELSLPFFPQDLIPTDSNAFVLRNLQSGYLVEIQDEKLKVIDKIKSFALEEENVSCYMPIYTAFGVVAHDLAKNPRFFLKDRTSKTHYLFTKEGKKAKGSYNFAVWRENFCAFFSDEWIGYDLSSQKQTFRYFLPKEKNANWRYVFDYVLKKHYFVYEKKISKKASSFFLYQYDGKKTLRFVATLQDFPYHIYDNNLHFIKKYENKWAHFVVDIKSDKTKQADIELFEVK
ncbi:hypothetical protein [Hugenholtzia roseola]|uniref:hypothetical protein n=1 Tax=Hugenholtzia roseola TaxID=1002 RepID=UPI00040C8DD5|nr:hypothetical protein [Hugenholtzia roseola]